MEGCVSPAACPGQVTQAGRVLASAALKLVFHFPQVHGGNPWFGEWIRGDYRTMYFHKLRFSSPKSVFSKL